MYFFRPHGVVELCAFCTGTTRSLPPWVTRNGQVMCFATSFRVNLRAISIASSGVAAPTTHWNWKFDCAIDFGALAFFSLMWSCQPARSQCSADKAMQAA